MTTRTNPFSNLYVARFKVGELTFPSVEHYVQWRLLSEHAPQRALRVLHTPVPADARRVGGVLPSNENEYVAAVRDGVHYKFAQNPELRARLAWGTFNASHLPFLLRRALTDERAALRRAEFTFILVDVEDFSVWDESNCIDGTQSPVQLRTLPQPVYFGGEWVAAGRNAVIARERVKLFPANYGAVDIVSYLSLVQLLRAQNMLSVVVTAPTHVVRTIYQTGDVVFRAVTARPSDAQPPIVRITFSSLPGAELLERIARRAQDA